MRTTIRINEQLLKDAIKEAIRQKKNLTAIIEDGLQAPQLRQHTSLTTVDKQC